MVNKVKFFTMMTSRVKNMDDNVYLGRIAGKLTTRQRSALRSVIMMIDVIYVKLLSYHRGSIFGIAQNDGDNLAQTVLAIVINACLEVQM